MNTNNALTSLNLVPTCLKNHKSRAFLRFSDVWDSYDQCEHTILDIPDGRRLLRCDQKNRNHFYFKVTSQTVPDVGDFYDVIRRIGTISTSKLHPRRSLTSATFTVSVNMKFVCLGRSPTIGDSYDECEHQICLSGTSGMQDFVFTCYQSFIFSELSIINVQF